jgi:RNA polymerase sigma factor (sigma-70 family)
MEPITASAARLAGSSLLRLQSDERLAKLASLGNQAAFEALVRRYRGELLRACSRILDGAAEDAVQQALMKAHQALLRNGPPERFRPWLHRIAVNSALDMLEREADTVPIEDSFDGVERPDETYERQERVRSTVGAISGLPDAQRRALVLRELEGRSHDEIARELGLSPGAARQLIYRARNSVRSAASALTPPVLLLRLLGPGSAETARPIAEAAAGGAAGGFAAKAAVTAIVAGGLAGAATVGPLDRSGDEGRDQAQASRDGGSSGEDAVAAVANGAGPGTSGSSGPGGGESGEGGGGSSGPGPGDGDDDSGHGSDNSGPGSDNSGPGSDDFDEGDSGDDNFELDDDSNSGPGSSSSGSGSGSSGSGSSGSGSVSSGSGSSGSGSSGSGSGISGGGTSGSGSSGSSGSGSGEPELEPTYEDSGGSGSSGSGSSGSG